MKASASSRRDRRWPGPLLSLLVPGFGLVRAGLPWRGAGWFLALWMGSLALGICAGLDSVPMPVVLGVLAGLVLGQIWMLVESWRPGRMTWPLWVVFGGVFGAVLLLPQPASLVVRCFTIPSEAMAPTLGGAGPTGSPDYVVADRLSYRFGAPRRGDLMVFNAGAVPGIQLSPSEKGREVFYVKRLVGLPGERIRIADGKVFADGRPLGDADGIPSSIGYTGPADRAVNTHRDAGDYVVGANEYFVLGDNPRNSLDSRYWGGVPASAVYGRVTLIYYPFERAGRLPRSGR